jgi:hypothetical protein
MTNSKTIVLLSLALAGTGAAQPAPAPSAQASQPVRHEGLFLRITPGVGASAAEGKTTNADLKISGGAGRLGIAVGWALRPGLNVIGELVGHAILGPDLEFKGAQSMTENDVIWGVSFGGAGLNFYTAGNMYFVVTGGALMMSLDSKDIEMKRSSTGFGSKIGVGKEWFVSSEVGLGLGLELLGGYVPDGDADWSVATLGLSLSATYN